MNNLDIVQIADGFDLGCAASSIPKAANVISVQLGELEYAENFGIDKKYFLTSQVNFQLSNFRAHVVQKLSENQISVTEVLQFLQALYGKITYAIDTANDNVKGFIK